MRQRDRSHCPISIKFGFERMFVFKPLDRTERGFSRRNEQYRCQAVAGATVESGVAFAQRREYVARKLVHLRLLAGGLLYLDIRVYFLSLVNSNASAAHITTPYSGWRLWWDCAGFSLQCP